jgi:hypothetical protein
LTVDCITDKVRRKHGNVVHFQLYYVELRKQINKKEKRDNGEAKVVKKCQPAYLEI